MSKLKKLRLSLEELVDEGVTKQEIEYTFFARCDNMDWINPELLTEQQEQAEVHVPLVDNNFGQIRVRSIDDSKYELCIKVKLTDELGKREAEQATTKDMFDLMLLIAPHSLRKKRYCYPIDGTDLKWEVDVFENAEGVAYNWIKIDLEVNDPDTVIPEFPIELAEVIMNQGVQRTEQENKTIETLFDAWAIKR